ncbi:MAG: hypothetical protein JNL90_02760 [Planctomycetes bacterium]|nr:hypothetical protein [Planctomycetota bacterium]
MVARGLALAALLLAAVARLAAADDPAPLFAAGRERAALAACDAALAAAPAADELRRLRARCLLELERPAEAAAALASAPRGDLAAQLLALRCRAEAGEETAPLLAELAALPLPAGDPRAALLRVRFALARGRGGEAWKAAEPLAAGPDAPAEVLLVRALALQAIGRAEAAAAAFAALEARPEALHERREAWRVRALQLMQARDYADAAELFARVAAASDAASPCVRAAICHGFRRHYGDAIAMWEEAVRREPEQREYQVRLADLYRSQGRQDDALRLYEPLAAAEPPHPVALLRVAELALERGDTERASGAAERAAALAPESGDVALLRARVAEKRGERASAIELLRVGLARNPLRFDASYRLALLLARSPEAAAKEEGAALLARYRRLEPWIEELDTLRQELAAAPRQPALLSRMAGLLNLGGEYALAKGLLARAEQLAPLPPSALVQAGYIHANLGELPAARARFAAALAQVEARGEAAAAKQLRAWIGQIDRGEPLPTPMGEMASGAAAPDEKR